MTAWQYMINLHKVCHFMSKERQGKASNSELQRWLKNKVVRFNGDTLTPTCEVDFPVNKLTLFTKAKRITIL